MVWIATMVEPLTESLLLGLVASWAAKTIFGLTRVGFFAVHELAWIVMDLLVVSALRGQKMGLAETVDWLYVWGVREALALPIWVKAICGGNQVVWRGVKYRIVKNGKPTIMRVLTSVLTPPGSQAKRSRTSRTTSASTCSITRNLDSIDSWLEVDLHLMAISRITYVSISRSIIMMKTALQLGYIDVVNA